jgi:hypothetical protein
VSHPGRKPARDGGEARVRKVEAELRKAEEEGSVDGTGGFDFEFFLFGTSSQSTLCDEPMHSHSK